MELARIQVLLEDYFEGNSNLEQEELLQEYFSGKKIHPEVLKYQPMFAGFRQAREEVSNVEVSLPASKRNNRTWWYGIAASAVITLTIGGYMFNQNSLTQQEQQALAAYQEARSTMMLLSENLNKGTESIAHLNAFAKGKEQVALLDEFAKNKKLILK